MKLKVFVCTILSVVFLLGMCLIPSAHAEEIRTRSYNLFTNTSYFKSTDGEILSDGSILWTSVSPLNTFHILADFPDIADIFPSVGLEYISVIYSLTCSFTQPLTWTSFDVGLQNGSSQVRFVSSTPDTSPSSGQDFGGTFIVTDTFYPSDVSINDYYIDCVLWFQNTVTYTNYFKVTALSVTFTAHYYTEPTPTPVPTPTPTPEFTPFPTYSGFDTFDPEVTLEPPDFVSIVNPVALLEFNSLFSSIWINNPLSPLLNFGAIVGIIPVLAGIAVSAIRKSNQSSNRMSNRKSNQSSNRMSNRRFKK